MRSWVLRISLAAAVALFLYLVDLPRAFEAGLDAVQALGPLAAPAFVLLHAAAVVAFVPSVIPSIAAGALFGFWIGLPVSVLGGALGAVAAFGLGRTLGRSAIERRLGHDLRFAVVSQLARERGWKIVALARLSPVLPFVLGNYVLGLTAMPARHYFLASALGTIPSNAVYVFLGAAAGRAAGHGEAWTPLEGALLALGLAATVALVLYLRRVASEAFRDARRDRDDAA